MKKPVVFVLICLVWGWTPSSGTTVISPAAELGKCSTWLSLLQGAGLAPEPLAPTRAFVSWGWAAIVAADVGGGGGALRSQPPSPLPLPPLLAGGAAPLLSLGVGVRKGESPGMKRAGAKGVVVRTCGRSGGLVLEEQES